MYILETCIAHDPAPGASSESSFVLNADNLASASMFLNGRASKSMSFKVLTFVLSQASEADAKRIVTS